MAGPHEEKTALRRRTCVGRCGRLHTGQANLNPTVPWRRSENPSFSPTVAVTYSGPFFHSVLRATNFFSCTSSPTFPLLFCRFLRLSLPPSSHVWGYRTSIWFQVPLWRLPWGGGYLCFKCSACFLWVHNCCSGLGGTRDYFQSWSCPRCRALSNCPPSSSVPQLIPLPPSISSHSILLVELWI